MADLHSLAPEIPSVPPLRLPDLEGAPAEDIIRWGLGEFFPEIGVACSMQDAVVVDLAVKIQPAVEVFFLQTEFHFQETIETAQRMRERYNLNLIELRPVANPALYSVEGYEACCGARKVEPLNRYLAQKRAWVSGIRRADGPERAEARAVEWDARRGLVKINPIVGWSDEDVGRYITENDIIVNPLHAKGYESIGCYPCTVPGKGREGRWTGSSKTECGLHIGPALDHPPNRTQAGTRPDVRRS